MKKRNYLYGLVLLFAFTACQRQAEVGDYYHKNGDKGIVLTLNTAGEVEKILSLQEAKNICADSALLWAEQAGEGWNLTTPDDLKIMATHKVAINETLKQKNQPPIMEMNTWYWSNEPCNEKRLHFMAYGPNGLKAYYHENASPLYRARLVKEINN